MKSLLFALSILTIFMGCGESSSNTQNEQMNIEINHRDAIRLKQYKIKGAKVYATYCANCHQNDGKGLALLYPPLAASDYLIEDLKRAACIIKNGQMEEIVVNNQAYNQMMPEVPITNLEIAEVITFITNEWGNEAGLTPVKSVEKWLKICE